MMKILKPGIYSGENNDTYYKSNVEMVVGTYGGVAGSGILYVAELALNSTIPAGSWIIGHRIAIQTTGGNET